jgi:hypothetical protein
MKFIITENQDKKIRSFVRRIGIADKIISELDPKDICKYWDNTENDALHFSDDIIVGIVWEINDTLNINSYHNKDLYKFFEDIGYYDKLIKFFHKAFESCE